MIQEAIDKLENLKKQSNKLDVLGLNTNKSYYILEKNVIEWGREKGILKKGTPLAQLEKTEEEVEELKQAILTKNREEVIDALGDILVTIILQAEMQNLYLTECLESAYNVIKKRKGVMRDGQFIKEA